MSVLSKMSRIVRPVFKDGGRRLSRSAGASLAARKVRQHPGNVMDDIDLLVCDMAGTTVEEGGMVYVVLQRAMNEDGLHVTDEAMHPWHGAKKEAVIEHFATQQGTPKDQLQARMDRISDNFLEQIKCEYFSKDSKVRYIHPDLPDHFSALRKSGVKIGLDTG